MNWKTEKLILDIEDKVRGMSWPISRQLFKTKKLGGQLVLENIDFTKEPHLPSKNFSKANLMGANFSGLEVRGVLFNEANLNNANFARTNLEYSEFRGADLRGSNFSKANLFECDFKNAIITDLPLPSRNKLLIAMGECLICEYKEDYKWKKESKVVEAAGKLIDEPALGGPLIRLVLPDLNYIAITRIGLHWSIYLADLLSFIVSNEYSEFKAWENFTCPSSIEKLEEMVSFLKGL